MENRIIVVGAGVVGLACAVALTRSGRQVTLIDEGEPGAGTSAGNPGGLSVSSVLPAAHPGVLRKVPGWLLDPDGPLVIKPRHLPRMAPWLARFLAASRRDRWEAGISALHGLTANAVSDWRDLLGAVGAPELLRPTGHLIVYRSDAQDDAETASWERRAALGMRIEPVGTERLREMVPPLAGEYHRARLVHDNGWLHDPREACRRMEHWLRGAGAGLRRARVTGLEPGGP
ncbi:FAD-dependent oxidoreductase, partial [Salipiger mucosus]|uniref:FAD-dependent oxidoreductase n=1 Tax=Salipiger mucosus TaxID=263378 RepID=UPI00035D784E